MNNSLEKAVDICGGQTALAKSINLTQPYIQNWLKRSNGIPPPEYCADIEKATNGLVTRRDLRPDDWQKIWPELTEQKAA